MYDLIVTDGLRWLYDKLEQRFGRLVAWLVTLVLGLSLVGVLAGLLFVLI